MKNSLICEDVPLKLKKDGERLLALAPRLCIGQVVIRGKAARATEFSAYYGEDIVQAQRREPYTGWVDPWCDKLSVGPGEFCLRPPIRRSARAVSIDLNNFVTIESVIIEHRHFEGPYPGYFECNDKQVNDIWQIAAHTVRCCSQEFLEDGTGRDGMCWIGDCAIAGAAELLAVDGAELLKHSLELFLSLARPDGVVPSNALYAGGHQLDRLPYLHIDRNGPLGAAVLANYVADYANAALIYYRWTGDDAMRGRFTPSVRAAGNWCAETLRKSATGESPGPYLSDNDGSVEGKWLKFPGMLAAQLYRGAMSAAEFARENIDLSEEREIALTYQTADGAFSSTIGGEPGRHATAAAVLAGLVPSTNKLFDDRHFAGDAPLVSGYAASNWLAAIAESGDTGLLLEHLRRWWGPMLAAGSTTAWERVEPKDGSFPRPNGAPVSQCHAWSGAPAAILPLAILGIKCRAPGWASVSFTPRLGPLKWARATVPTPLGVIEVRAESNPDGSVTVEKKLPPGCHEIKVSP